MAPNEAKENRLFTFILKHVNKLCMLSYVLGVVGFLALPYRDFSENHYHSENALLTGLQTFQFGYQEGRETDQYNEVILGDAKSGGLRAVQERLISVMSEYSITAYKQKFSVKAPLPHNNDNEAVYETRNGTNIYGFIRAGRSSSTESLVLNIPISKDKHNYAIGLALALGTQIRSQQYWAKDVVLLFTELGHDGAQAWLQSYYDVRKSDFIKAEPLEERAGAILGAVVLELPSSPSYINAEVVGNNGQLPNLDLFNVVTKLAKMGPVQISIGGILSKNPYDVMKMYTDALKTTVKMMSKQARGYSTINHATFLQHNVQSLTLQGVKVKNGRQLEFARIGRIVEGILRSLNNLLEKLHHSYFFYLISATDRFISIVLYMPPLGLILLAPTLKALCLWMSMRQDEEKKEEDSSKAQDQDESNDSLEDLIKQDRSEEAEEKESTWMGVFYIISVSHLLGVMLYFSPTYASSWSKMYGLSAEDSIFFIFMSTYMAAIPLPFASLFRFSENPKVYELLRIVALVLFTMILGCTAVMNFSLAMVVAVASAPLITPIYANSGRLSLLLRPLAFLASPMMIALAAFYANQYIFNEKAGTLKDSAMDVIRIPYEQSLMGNSWNYELACLLLYPNWILFWFLSAAKVEVEQ